MGKQSQVGGRKGSNQRGYSRVLYMCGACVCACVCGEGRKSATPLHCGSVGWMALLRLRSGPSRRGVTFLQHLLDTSATPVALEQQLSNPRHHNVWTVSRPFPPRHASPPPPLTPTTPLQTFVRFCLLIPLCFLVVVYWRKITVVNSFTTLSVSSETTFK